MLEEESLVDGNATLVNGNEEEDVYSMWGNLTVSKLGFRDFTMSQKERDIYFKLVRSGAF
uniref:Uncharacterized protein n=1 Tax=Solanum tuberosum TaxID=4113 RepID=M1AZF8_SOLTU